MEEKEKSQFAILVKQMQEMTAALERKDNQAVINAVLDGPAVMKMLNICSRTLQSYRDNGVLGFYRVSRKKMYYKYADVVALLEKNYTQPFNPKKK
jgi:hypothetical protein